MQEVTVYTLRKDKSINLNSIFESFPSQVQEHISKYKNEDARGDSICGYYLLAHLLSNSRQFSLNDITFTGSKPSLSGIYFSISHSNGMVACCITESPVGIDIEQFKELPQNVPKSFIDSRSYGELLKDKDSAGKEIIRWWTVRESIGKYLGTGITREVLSLPLTRDGDRFLGDEFYTNTKLLTNFALSVTMEHPFNISVMDILPME